MIQISLTALSQLKKESSKAPPSKVEDFQVSFFDLNMRNSIYMRNNIYRKLLTEHF